MATSAKDALTFCQLLHERLADQLADADAVRARVESLLPRNSFRESCFCKGCVLPSVDSLALGFLTERHSASRADVHLALRCEGFDTPLYDCDATQVGFSSHSRSNSYHPGDKSGQRAQSRRSPDFCIRLGLKFRLVGEIKYLPRVRPADLSTLVRELKDYLSIAGEPTSDWGHDFGYGLVYQSSEAGEGTRATIMDYWETDRIFISCLPRRDGQNPSK